MAPESATPLETAEVRPTGLLDDPPSMSPLQDHLILRTTPDRTTIANDSPHPRKWNQVSSGRVLLVVDLVCLSTPALWEHAHYRALLTSALLTCLLFWSAELYRPRLQAFVLNEAPALLGCLLATTAIVATFSSIRHPTIGVSTYLVAAAYAIVLCLLGRTLVNSAIRLARRHGWVQHRTIIVGSGPVAVRINEILSIEHNFGLNVVGYVADEPAPDAIGISRDYLGEINSLQAQTERLGVKVLIIIDSGFTEAELASLVLRQALWIQCSIFIVPRLHELSSQAWHTDMIGSIPVMRVGHCSRTGLPWKCKRAFDIALSALSLILLAPLMAACALAVRIDGGPGILFQQIRVGRDGQPFELLKFRSLRPADDHEASTHWSVAADRRISPLGRFLRRTSLDELPQLWNILRGDMSIVGPRPERPHFVDKFTGEDPTYWFRHRVPSGLTGLAQVNGMRGDTSISERAYFDNYYIDNWSLWLDAKIILRTFSEVLFGRGR